MNLSKNFIQVSEKDIHFLAIEDVMVVGDCSGLRGKFA